MKALRHLVTLLGLGASLVQAAWGEPPACLRDDFTSMQLAPLTFLYDARDDLPQRSLVSDVAGPLSWLELEYSQGTLRLRNRMPELGLPAVFLWVRLDVLDGDGRVVEELSRAFPGNDTCALTSLFPGQISSPFKVPEWDRHRVDPDLRVRVRVWIPLQG